MARTRYTAPAAFQVVFDDAVTPRRLDELVLAVLALGDQGRAWRSIGDIWHELRRWKLQPQTPGIPTIYKVLTELSSAGRVQMQSSGRGRGGPDSFEWRLGDAMLGTDEGVKG